MSVLEQYFGRLAAAFVRGRLANSQENYVLPKHLATPLLDELTSSELEETILFGISAELKMYKFKRKMALARVQRVLGILQGLAPTSLLDVGSGRGTFLWPLLDTFPELLVTSIDKEDIRVRDIKAVNQGGVSNLSAEKMDITELSFEENSFDVITILEVLEHIPKPQEALNEAVRVAKNFVVLSVPTKEDDNPEHIHLFNQNMLKNMFFEAGALSVRFDYVLNHVVVIAKLGK